MVGRRAPAFFLHGREAGLSLPAPNPTRSGATLTLSLPEASEVRAEVVDLLGGCVQTLAAGTHEAGRVRLAVSGLAAGTYLVRVAVGDNGTAGTVLTRRLTVAR